jgi:CHAT domain-containing protein
MSLSYQGRGEFRQAREAQEQALSIFRLWGTSADVTHASLNLGIILLRQGDTLQASDVLENALNDARKQGFRGAEAIALHALARASSRNPIKARSYAEQAISIMETVRRDAVRDELKAKYMEATSGCYDLLISILVANSPAFAPGEGVARAFEVSEQRKARNLLDSLASTRPPMSPEDLAARRRLQKKIEYYEAEMERLKLSDVSLKPLQQAQAERLEQLRDLDAHSQAQQDNSSAPTTISLKKAQELLDDRTLLLVYHLGAEHSFLWLVTPGGAEVYVLPREREIETLARKFHELLATSQKPVSEKEALMAAKDLGRMLLGPVVGRLENKRLVIVPDGALHYVPFGALLEDTSQTRLRSGYPGSAPRLFEKHEVLSLPSVSVMAALRERKKGQAQFRGDLVLFAAPIFQEGYDDLPNTRTEARAIRKLIPPGTRFVEKLGYEATKEAAMSGLLRGFNTVHFATHGTIDTEHPELTAIVLTQVNRQGVPQDGYLRVHDIWALNIPADLVVLSACKTALGKEMRAEGLVGLTQSFFHAGSSSVLVSLWNVDDKSTPEFMAIFYRGLYVEHRSPAEALRAAQSWMSKHPRWHSPYYWAGFVLQGEWR